LLLPVLSAQRSRHIRVLLLNLAIFVLYRWMDKRQQLCLQ
jgi:hypothetical protein